MGGLVFAVDWGDVPTWLGGVGGVIGACIAGYAAHVARKAVGVSANAATAGQEAVEIAKQALAVQKRPLFSPAGAPETVLTASGGVEVLFTVRNIGAGVARIETYRVLDAFETPEVGLTEHPNSVPAAAGEPQPLRLDVLADDGAWFVDVVKKRGEWAFELIYTDVDGQQRTQSRFAVGPAPGRTGWRLAKQHHAPISD